MAGTAEESVNDAQGNLLQDQCRHVRKTVLSGFTNGTSSITNTTACLYDGNGSVMALLDAADKSIVASYEYDALGNTLRATGAKACVTKLKDTPRDRMCNEISAMATASDCDEVKGNSDLYRECLSAATWNAYWKYKEDWESKTGEKIDFHRLFAEVYPECASGVVPPPEEGGPRPIFGAE